MSKFITDIQAKILSRSSAIEILDEDERRVRAMVMAAASPQNLNVWSWTTSEGLKLVFPTSDASKESYRGERTVQKEVANPQKLLEKMGTWALGGSVIIAHDFNSLLNRAPTAPVIARGMKDLAVKMQGMDIEDKGFAQLIVLDTEKAQYPCGYQKLAMPLPDREELGKILDEVLRTNEMEVGDDLRVKILNAVQGLPAFQAANALAESLARHGEFDVTEIASYKKQLVEAKGIEIVDPDPRGLDAIGGMLAVKEYLREAAPAFDSDLASEYDLDSPKGIIFSGYPGGGKSAMAKALASYLGFVLLRADLGSARGMYQGQSEEGIENILKTAEAVAPCVLWIDEIEKAVSGAGQGGQTDGGTGDRMFGKLITFMQETKAQVFMYFTANRPQNLPPELTRAGRLDKQFWVGVPSVSARRSIIDVFCAKYRRAANIDREALVEASEGYMGAEIETAIKAALRVALSQRLPEVTTEMVLEKLSATPQVSKTFDMTSELQKWADAADAADPPETEVRSASSKGRKIKSVK